MLQILFAKLKNDAVQPHRTDVIDISIAHEVRHRIGANNVRFLKI